DVLLYSFFGTSTLRDQWRVIYGYMKKCDWLEDKLPQCFPAFHELFYRNNFVMATMCFEKAGDTLWETLAKASDLRASTYRMLETNHESFEGYVREAAGMFESIGKIEHAASCYCDLKEYERAGKFFFI
ncbi:UvrD-like helicase, ATP-binding domain, P-loop containing nucleoside triphosphate hydrolase, partial [Tanacetum coccineum]